MKHKHHITPKHAGGSDDLSNIVELTITQHAMYHFANWQFRGRKEDWIAWKGLAGICTKEKIVEDLMQLGRDKGKLNREAAVKTMFEEGTHPFLSSVLIEKRKPVNAKCIAEYNRSSKGRLKSKETVTRTNLRKDQCPTAILRRIPEIWQSILNNSINKGKRSQERTCYAKPF